MHLVTVIQLLAADVILAIAPTILYRYLHGIIGVRASVILEPVGPGCCASTIQGQYFPIFCANSSHRLVSFGNSSCRNCGESCTAVPDCRKVWSSHPIPLGLRGTSETVVARPWIGRSNDDRGRRRHYLYRVVRWGPIYIHKDDDGQNNSNEEDHIG